jgi:4-diphosphocytidyl-2-C-methyl-D-erythritol kinase
MAVRELAFAKLNLTLTVLGRRPDGFHDIESLVTFADLHDVIALEPGDDDSLSVAGPFARAIGSENILVRTLALLRDADPKLRLGSVRLDKALPVAAGLGGGSADAAALLRAVRHANPGHLQSIPWLDIAARLGADVPVCLEQQPALMWGTGERMERVQRLPSLNALLVNPGLPLHTSDVFSALAAAPAPAGRSTPKLPDLTRMSDLLDYMRARGNDLQPAVLGLLPVVAEVRAALNAQPGCLLAAMSGSGPTWFGIFADRGRTLDAAARIAGTQPGWWVRPALLQGSGRS